MSLSPEERKLRARLAQQTRLATEDPVAMTAPARSAFQQSFIDKAWDSIGPFEEAVVHAHPGMPESELFKLVEAEVLRRAAALRSAHYTRLSLASATARRMKKGRAALVSTPGPEEAEAAP